MSAKNAKSTEIGLDIKGNAATITLTSLDGRRPPVIDLGVLDQLNERLDQLGARSTESGSVRAVVLRSSSPRFFCAGGNMDALAKLNGKTMAEWIERGHSVFARIETLEIPTIAVVGGYALGGGLELALACDIIYATDQARFGQTEVRLGFVTGWGGGRRLSERVGVARAKEMSFTGKIVEAQFVGNERAVEERLAQTIRDICQGADHAIRAMKSIILQSAVDPGANLMLEKENSVLIVDSLETARRMRDFFNRRKKP
jgi:enoyl-CoA hydratase